MSVNFKKLRKFAGEAIVKYNMISDGDRILCGLSGGKDSFVLVDLCGRDFTFDDLTKNTHSIFSLKNTEYGQTCRAHNNTCQQDT